MSQSVTPLPRHCKIYVYMGRLHLVSTVTVFHGIFNTPFQKERDYGTDADAYRLLGLFNIRRGSAIPDPSPSRSRIFDCCCCVLSAGGSGPVRSVLPRTCWVLRFISCIFGMLCSRLCLTIAPKSSEHDRASYHRLKSPTGAPQVPNGRDRSEREEGKEEEEPCGVRMNKLKFCSFPGKPHLPNIWLFELPEP